MTSLETNLPVSGSEPAVTPMHRSGLLHRLMNGVLVFWVIVILALLLGSAPRLLSYDYGLPYIEYIDELMIYLIGQRERGISHSGNIRGTAYPPGFVQLQVVTQQIMESQGQPGPTPSIHALRVVVLLVNLVGIVWVALLARHIGGNPAALVASFGWAVSTRLLDVTVHAIGESLVCPLLVLDLLCAATALTSPRKKLWIAASLLVGGVIILFEYRMVVALLPGLLVLLFNILDGRQIRLKQWVIYGAVGIIALIVFSVIGLLVAQSVLPARWYRILEEVLTRNLWDVPVVLFYLQAVIAAVNTTVFLILMALGIAAYVIAQRQGFMRVNLRVLAPTALLFFIIPWLTSAFRVYGNEETEILVRHIVPAMGLGFILLGAAAAQIIYCLPSLKLRTVVAPLLAALVVVPQLQPTIALASSRAVDPWPVIVREWADTNLTPGTIIVYSTSDRWFNPLWGGIPHRKWFDWWKTSDIHEYPLDEWVEQRRMSYAAVPISIYRNWSDSEAGQEWLSRTLLLREFVHPPVRREAEVAFLRLWRMQHETDVHFGDHIRMTGYDQSAELVHSGDTVDFTFYWNAPTTPDDNYSLFVHLVPEDEYTVLAQADGSPAVPERLTLSWDEPTETLISPPFTLTIPPDLAPGNYRVVIGLYNFSTGVRLPVADSDLGDAYLLTTLHVDAQSQ